MSRGGSQSNGENACSPDFEGELPFDEPLTDGSTRALRRVNANTWPGKWTAEARALYIRAREAGMSVARAVALGCIGSFRQAWIFRKSIAKHCGISVRTVQRAITQGKEFGLIGVARAKKDEIPPGLDHPLPCGWSHRWVIGWGQAAAAVKQQVADCRLARMVKAATRAERAAAEIGLGTAPASGPRQQRPVRRWTGDEIDAELERLARTKAPPD